MILDFQMPVMNGLDAARLIRKFAPSTVIVMLTMHESAQLRTEARNVGVEDVISKCGTFGNELLAFLTNFESKNFPTGVMVRI